jgi:hypothetical protein
MALDIVTVERGKGYGVIGTVWRLLPVKAAGLYWVGSSDKRRFLARAL